MAQSKIAGISAKKLAEYFEYLDALRESGITNMFGASPYLTTAYGLSREKSASILSVWMKTFDRDISANDRASKMSEAADAAQQ